MNKQKEPETIHQGLIVTNLNKITKTSCIKVLFKYHMESVTNPTRTDIPKE